MFRQDLASPATTTPPAPLDTDEVLRALAPFEAGRMLPKAAYLDEAVLAWERAHIFTGWICLGRSAEVPSPHGVKAFSVGETGVLVARDDDGTLHAFENACRHRGHELLPCDSSAQPRAIVCPYHAWTYGFDGALKGAPGFRDADGFDTSAFGLKAMPVQDWHGWIFVDTSGQGDAFSDHVRDLEDIVAPYDAESLQTAVTHVYDVAANWKVIVENYQECYHCPMIHPELCRVSPPDSGENLESEGSWVGGWMELRGNAETMSLDGRSRGVVMARLDEHESRTVMYVALLPNLLMSLHPDYVMSHLLWPLSPNRTRIQCSWAFPPQAVEQDRFDPAYAVDFWDLTNKQDWAACESVQRGIRTPRFEPGPLAPSEDGVYQFVTHMARAYLGTSRR
jgi:glycine betaine catabolism A